MIDWQTADRMQCSSEEKQHLYAFVDYFEELSVKSRRLGLLTLEEAAQSDVVKAHPILALGLEMVVDGLDPSDLESILKDLIRATNNKGVALLEQLTILEGILAIQRGDGPRVVRVRLAALFGEKSGVPGLTARQYFTRDRLEHRLDARGNAETRVPKLEFLLMEPDENIQGLCLLLNQEQIASALRGASPALLRKFLENIATRAAHQILDLLEESPWVPARTEEAQREIAEIYRKEIASMEKKADRLPPGK
jgi:hypothetical protein